MFGWSASGLGTSLAPIAIADGFLVYNNAYDGQIYSIGKGPSATTVTVAPKISVQGSSVLIEGTVMDTAAGTKQKEQAARFPDVVPAVSDESMSDWMEYVYMQKPRPTNVIGVNVTLSERDSNNNVYPIGTVTTDSSGAYSFMWQPPIPGKYTIYATFAGSEAYWLSSAETACGVDLAPSPAVPAATPVSPTVTPPPTATPTLTPSPSEASPPPKGGLPTEAYVAIASVVIIAIVAAIALILRRRK